MAAIINANHVVFFILFLFVVIHVEAEDQGRQSVNLADPYWQERAKEAAVFNKQAFNAHPEIITDEFNANVGE